MKLGIIGSPVSHSLSPWIHTFIGNALNMPVIYTRLDTSLSALPERLKELAAGEYRGVNVTAPLKTRTAALLLESGLEIPDTGSVNTIRFDAHRIDGCTNTDILGFEFLFGTAQAHSIAILGAGGVLPSVLSVLERVEVPHVVVYNRSVPKSQVAHAQINRNPQWMRCELSRFLTESKAYDMVINCLPAFAQDHLVKLDGDTFKPDCQFVDLNYGSPSNRTRATILDCEIAYRDGLPMLVKQAVASFEFWTERAVPRFVFDELMAHIPEIQPG